MAIEDQIQRLKQINDQKAASAVSQARHDDAVLSNIQTQETIVRSFRLLLDYLDNKTTKTEVVNQLSEIRTPDVEEVVRAVESLHQTISTHENTDLTEVTTVLREVLEQTKQLPKENPTIPEQKVIDYTEQLNGLKDTMAGVEKVIKAQKLVAEAPIVNVPEPVVHVDAPDLSDINSGLTDIVKAVKKIIIPEYKTDNTKVEKLLGDANKLLKKIVEKPVGGGGGGGGQTWVSINSDGIPVPIPLTAGNAIPVDIQDATITAVDDTVATSTDVSLASSASTAQLLAANTSRKGLLLNNTDANPVYIYYGTTAALTKFSVRIPANGYWEMPQPVYTGRIDAIWSADGSGSLIGSEL